MYKPIPGFSKRYMINRQGDVYSLYKKGSLIQQKNNIGYRYVLLMNDSIGMSKICLVHRLVAITFIKNPLNKITVNHKNCIKIDNRSKNLEWATHKENVLHAYNNNLYKRRLVKDYLSLEIRINIFNEYKRGGTSIRKLAKKYNIGRYAVTYSIKNIEKA